MATLSHGDHLSRFYSIVLRMTSPLGYISPNNEVVIMSIPHAVALSSIIGRIVAALRQEMGLSQAALAGRVRWDRSLLARTR